jgi:hypothetical protein
MYGSPQDTSKSHINPQLGNSFNNPLYMSQQQKRNQSNQNFEQPKYVSDSGQNPQPQIRIRTDPFRQKPSNDLTKFEERLMHRKEPGPAGNMQSVQNPSATQYSAGPQHGSATQNKNHRGSNKKLPQLQSSESQRKKQLSS